MVWIYQALTNQGNKMNITTIYNNNQPQKFFSCADGKYNKGGLRALKNAAQRKIDGEYVPFGFECTTARFKLVDCETFECVRV